jgi:hypothetical protein
MMNKIQQKKIFGRDSEKKLDNDDDDDDHYSPLLH